MERDQIMEMLRKLVAERFELDPAVVTESTRQSEAGIDSILMLDLMMDIEETLGLTFKSLDLPRDPSLGEIADLIESNLADASNGNN